MTPIALASYKNKYPLMGLMKLAAYFRKCNDNIRFFKGDLRTLAANLLCEEFISITHSSSIAKYSPQLANYIRTGKYSFLEVIPDFCNLNREIIIKHYRKRFTAHDFPQFDIIAVTTLFTFCWKETVDTINAAKDFCAPSGRILVGGIAASLVPNELERETGITPITGTLNTPGVIDPHNSDIIDALPLDYSILEEAEARL